MLLGKPWWVWVVLLAVAVVMARWRAAKAWRASVRAELVACLRREVPERDIVAVRDREIDLRAADGSVGTLRLDRLFAELRTISDDDAPGREALFAKVVNMLRESERMAQPDPERDRKRLRPRLAADTFLQQLRGDARDVTIPAVPSGVPGLSVVFVLDSESSVAYVTGKHLAELGLTAEEALALAKANLAPTFDAKIVRGAVSDRTMSMVKCGDTFDAARLLLVADLLQEGEQVAVVIPDRDTLAVTSVPANGDWSGLRTLARAAAGPVLWDKPLLVTRAGISAAPADPR
jgi:hypothetical protein